VAKTDEFTFNSTPASEDLVVTKRSFLRELSKVLDPLGFLAPFHIRAKMIMQEIWLTGADWDEQLGPDLHQKAVQWLTELLEIPAVRFPRCLQLNHETRQNQLHVFVDASQDAYGAVVYDVKSYDSGEISSRLVSAKSRVSPLKSVSIPRLELMAAVLGVNLLMAVADALQSDITCAILWTDSQNVLCWIKNHSKHFKSFVANRVSFIQEHTVPCQWKYVPTEINAADILSRGTCVAGLNNKAWMCGPTFLENDETRWPTQPVSTQQTDKMEQRTIQTPNIVTMITLSTTTWRQDPCRFSSYMRLCRVLAWTLRFINALQC